MQNNQPTDDECPICMENITTDAFITSCHHKFHKECFLKIVGDKCPMCRKNIPTSDVFVYDIRQRREMFMQNYMDDIQRMRTQIRAELEMERQEMERREMERRERQKLDSNCVIC